jgi:ribosomal protein S18 acetylase RimI-like enzyme
MEYPRTLDYFSEESFRTAIILVALLNGVPVAYERLKEEFEPCTLWVKDLAVRKEVRRQGIASVLLLAAQDWASQRNLKRVIVEIQSKNASAIKLVNKLGYEFCGYQDHYFANQDIALFFMRYLR